MLFNDFYENPFKWKNTRLQLYSTFRKSHLADCHNIANFDMIIFVILFFTGSHVSDGAKL